MSGFNLKKIIKIIKLSFDNTFYLLNDNLIRHYF